MICLYLRYAGPFRLYATLLLSCICLTIFSATLTAQDCMSLIRRHNSQETIDTTWNLSLKANTRAALFYYGALHSDDPQHTQFPAIISAWEKFLPDVAFYEGPDRGIDTTWATTISKYGESGLVRYMATQAHIGAYSLEPPIEKLYTYLQSLYPQEEVDIYMFTKEAMRLRTRKSETKEELTADISKMMQMIPGMVHHTLAINTTAQLDSTFRKYFPMEINWWQTPEDWYAPAKAVEETGSFTNALARSSSEYRDIYMVQLLATHINMGEKIFAVVGRNHIPMQAEALKCVIDNAK